MLAKPLRKMVILTANSANYVSTFWICDDVRLFAAADVSAYSFFAAEHELPPDVVLLLPFALLLNVLPPPRALRVPLMPRVWLSLTFPRVAVLPRVWLPPPFPRVAALPRVWNVLFV